MIALLGGGSGWSVLIWAVTGGACGGLHAYHIEHLATAHDRHVRTQTHRVRAGWVTDSDIRDMADKCAADTAPLPALEGVVAA